MPVLKAFSFESRLVEIALIRKVGAGPLPPVLLGQWHEDIAQALGEHCHPGKNLWDWPAGLLTYDAWP